MLMASNSIGTLEMQPTLVSGERNSGTGCCPHCLSAKHLPVWRKAAGPKLRKLVMAEAKEMIRSTGLLPMSMPRSEAIVIAIALCYRPYVS
jgi:hypothetical protein